LRLIREAYICSRLQHPGIIPVHGIGWIDNRPFFTMTLVEGQTLAEKLVERQSVDSDRMRFLRIYSSICEAVAYAHSNQTVHRDLKPNNIMLGHHGEVFVMDWGLAKVIGESPVDRVEARKIRRAERKNRVWIVAFGVALAGLVALIGRDFVSADRVALS